MTRPTPRPPAGRSGHPLAGRERTTPVELNHRPVPTYRKDAWLIDLIAWYPEASIGRRLHPPRSPCWRGEVGGGYRWGYLRRDGPGWQRAFAQIKPGVSSYESDSFIGAKRYIPRRKADKS